MIENTDRFLPWSGRRYKVNQFGKILDSSDRIIEPCEINGELFVELEWVLGRKQYSAALIIMVGFGIVKIPEHLLVEIEPLYIDGNKKNLIPVNLIYRFKRGPLPVEHYFGFYYIPFYTDYGISVNGDIINVNTGKHKVWSVTNNGGPKNQTGGYFYNRVVGDDGVSKTLFLHRAMCLVFKKYDSNVFSLVVNHLDGNPSNNVLDNLEWATYARNNQHAYDTGLRPNAAKPILMKDLKTNEILRFESILACAKYLNNPRGDYIRARLENCPTKVFSDMLLFKYDDGTPWPFIDSNKIEITREGRGGDIVARNVFTGEKILFTGTYQGAHLTGVKAGTILRHVRENSLIPINGYNFRYLEFAKDWPVHSERHLKIYEKYPIYPPDGLIVTNIDTNEETFYCSVAEACNTLKINKYIVSDIVTLNKLWKNKYKFQYFKIRESLSPIEE
jgi:hypothetical protein